jgi:hypothetical protein
MTCTGSSVSRGFQPLGFIVNRGLWVFFGSAPTIELGLWTSGPELPVRLFLDEGISAAGKVVHFPDRR